MDKTRFGIYGGRYIPETLMNEIINLEKQYEYYKKDNEFIKELNLLLKNYAGRPSILYYAKNMTKDLGGAKIYLKREDLNHTGSHKINNVLGDFVSYVPMLDEHALVQRIKSNMLEIKKKNGLEIITTDKTETKSASNFREI